MLSERRGKKYFLTFGRDLRMEKKMQEISDEIEEEWK